MRVRYKQSQVYKCRICMNQAKKDEVCKDCIKKITSIIFSGIGTGNFELTDNKLLNLYTLLAYNTWSKQQDDKDGGDIDENI